MISTNYENLQNDIIIIINNIIQKSESLKSFILYREQVIQILKFLGIPENQCYSIMKNISKKRLKEIIPYREHFFINMPEKLINLKNINYTEAEEISKKIWNVIEDSSIYGVNMSHMTAYDFIK